MQHQVIRIQVAGSVQATLTTYLLDNYEEIEPDRVRPMIIVCPGGAYEWCSEREAEAVAIQFLARGYHAAVLRYDTCKNAVEFPQELVEAAEAVALMRERAQIYHIDTHKIMILGFSAGGHLAASLGVFWQERWLAERLGRRNEEIRPDAVLLGYPVITAHEFAHVGSVENLLGTQLSEEMKDKISLEKQVTEHMPPVFIWHTFADASVPVENSILFVSALRKAGVMTEFHMFPRGGHGLSLANRETAHPDGKEIQPEAQAWMNLCCHFIESF